jgi:sugar phosphate isomerase/epimerase
MQKYSSLLPSITIQYTQAGSLLERLEAIKEAGFTAVNLGSPMCLHLLQSTAGEIGVLQALLRQRGLAVDWLHAPYETPVLYEADSERGALSVGALKTAITIAAELEANSLIVHPFDLDFPPGIDGDGPVERLIETFSVLVEYGQRFGVDIAVENIDEPHSTRILDRLFAGVEGLRLCFDTGHAHEWRTWNHYLPAYLGRIAALHIHDNHGETDEHLLPGDGNIDFLPLLRSLQSINYRGFLGIECIQQRGNYPGGCRDLATTIGERMARLLEKADKGGPASMRESGVSPGR